MQGRGKASVEHVDIGKKDRVDLYMLCWGDVDGRCSQSRLSETHFSTITPFPKAAPSPIRKEKGPVHTRVFASECIITMMISESQIPDGEKTRTQPCPIWLSAKRSNKAVVQTEGLDDGRV